MVVFPELTQQNTVTNRANVLKNLSRSRGTAAPSSPGSPAASPRASQHQHSSAQAAPAISTSTSQERFTQKYPALARTPRGGRVASSPTSFAARRPPTFADGPTGPDGPASPPRVNAYDSIAARMSPPRGSGSPGESGSGSGAYSLSPGRRHGPYVTGDASSPLRVPSPSRKLGSSGPRSLPVVTSSSDGGAAGGSGARVPMLSNPRISPPVLTVSSPPPTVVPSLPSLNPPPLPSLPSLGAPQVHSPAPVVQGPVVQGPGGRGGSSGSLGIEIGREPSVFMLNSPGPTVTSALPTVTSVTPAVTSALPTVTSALPTVTSAVPTITSAVPTITSAVPTITSAVPVPTVPSITTPVGALPTPSVQAPGSPSAQKQDDADFAVAANGREWGKYISRRTTKRSKVLMSSLSQSTDSAKRAGGAFAKRLDGSLGQSVTPHPGSHGHLFDSASTPTGIGMGGGGGGGGGGVAALLARDSDSSPSSGSASGSASSLSPPPYDAETSPTPTAGALPKGANYLGLSRAAKTPSAAMMHGQAGQMAGMGPVSATPSAGQKRGPKHPVRPMSMTPFAGSTAPSSVASADASSSDVKTPSGVEVDADEAITRHLFAVPPRPHSYYNILSDGNKQLFLCCIRFYQRRDYVDRQHNRRVVYIPMCLFLLTDVPCPYQFCSILEDYLQLRLMNGEDEAFQALTRFLVTDCIYPVEGMVDVSFRILGHQYFIGIDRPCKLISINSESSALFYFPSLSKCRGWGGGGSPRSDLVVRRHDSFFVCRLPNSPSHCPPAPPQRCR